MQVWKLPASTIADLLARGEVSSREVVRAHLERIDELNSTLRAFTAVFHRQALADAERIDAARARGEPLGPLAGLPVSIKECFDMEGLPTTLGIPAWRDRVAPRDAALVALLRESGAIVLGRTNVSQTMLFVESRNPLYGQTANPFRLSHTPGGSSGGEAAAIASGMSPLGFGTDVGGSIRTPCHFVGICGLKPSLDRLPMRGVATVLEGQEAVRAQAGPMARTVSDLAFAMTAFDPRRLTALDVRVPPLELSVGESRDLRGLRVGLRTNDGVIHPSSAVIRAAERAADALRKRGCEIVPFTPPPVLDAMDAYLGALSSDGGARVARAISGGDEDKVMKPLLRMGRMPTPLRAALAGALAATGEHRMASMLRALGARSSSEYWEINARLNAYRFAMADALDEASVDVVLWPPYATPALPHGLSENFSLASSYSILWNVVQYPAGVVPVTRVRADEVRRDHARDRLDRQAAKIDAESTGMPVGVQVVARPWQESLVLAVMAAIEEDVRSDDDFPRTPVESIATGNVALNSSLERPTSDA